MHCLEAGAAPIVTQFHSDSQSSIAGSGRSMDRRTSQVPQAWASRISGQCSRRVEAGTVVLPRLAMSVGRASAGDATTASQPRVWLSRVGFCRMRSSTIWQHPANGSRSALRSIAVSGRRYSASRSRHARATGTTGARRSPAARKSGPAPTLNNPISLSAESRQLALRAADGTCWGRSASRWPAHGNLGTIPRMLQRER